MWLLETSARRIMQQAQAANFTPSVYQQSQFDARFGDNETSDGGGNRLLTVAGNVAEISIKGILTKEPSFLAMIFGGGNTTYSEIISALAVAGQNSDVTEIILAIDSPGGHFDGLFDALAAIQVAKKPISAVISNVAASAAFAIATQADSIEASNIAVRVGSVGILANFEIDEHDVVISSTKAPNKNPDVTTEEGVAIVREEIDPMHEIFVEAIASGRGTTTEKVNAEFGQGGVVLANEALKRGMIDSVAVQPLKVVKNTKSTTANSGIQPEAIKMDLNTLQAQHPETYAAAVQQGTNQERDRVTAHLTMGEASGDMKTACVAINDGSAMTATLQATYMTAGMNRTDTANRQKDDEEAEGADNATAEELANTQADSVSAIVEAKLGVQGE